MHMMISFVAMTMAAAIATKERAKALNSWDQIKTKLTKKTNDKRELVLTIIRRLFSRIRVLDRLSARKRNMRIRIKVTNTPSVNKSWPKSTSLSSSRGRKANKVDKSKNILHIDLTYA